MRSSNATGTCRHTWIANTAVVASRSAPTATWATVETTIGSSGCTLSCPQATRVTNAAKPRQSCVIRRARTVIAGLRIASIFEYIDSARTLVHVKTTATKPAWTTCGHQLMLRWLNLPPRISWTYKTNMESRVSVKRLGRRVSYSTRGTSSTHFLPVNNAIATAMQKNV